MASMKPKFADQKLSDLFQDAEKLQEAIAKYHLSKGRDREDAQDDIRKHGRRLRQDGEVVLTSPFYQRMTTSLDLDASTSFSARKLLEELRRTPGSGQNERNIAAIREHAKACIEALSPSKDLGSRKAALREQDDEAMEEEGTDSMDVDDDAALARAMQEEWSKEQGLTRPGRRAKKVVNYYVPGEDEYIEELEDFYTNAIKPETSG